MCDCWPLFRKGIKDVTWGWGILFVLTLVGWVLVLMVERSCEYVRIETSDDDKDDSSSFGRGLSRGRLEPKDECQGWAQYNDLQLDSQAIMALVAGTTSVLLGAFVWGYLWITVCCQPFPWFFQWIIVTTCVVVAGLQALTHTMTKSNLCRDMSVVIVDEGDGTQRVFDTCSKETTAYNLTFATMALYMAAAVLFALVRLHKTKADYEDDDNNDNHNHKKDPDMENPTASLEDIKA